MHPTRYPIPAVLILSLLLGCATAGAADFYVSANLGKGRKGTKEEPVKNIGNVLKDLAAGDTIHVAQGVYTGMSDAGWVSIEVPVKIIGGYDDTFSKRDPWGAHQTVLSGDNKSANYKNEIRLRIDLSKFNREKKMEFHRAGKPTVYDVVVDGIIVDNAGRNRYSDDKKLKIVRKANPKTGENPTPDGPGLSVMAPIFGTATVQNCVVVNCAPTEGALTVTGNEGGKLTVKNNLVVNNTGVGLFCRTAFNPSADKDVAEFEVANNTVLFSEKYDAFGGINGHAFKLDAAVKINAQFNVFAFSDQAGVFNAAKSKVKKLTLANNLVCANQLADMVEIDTKIPVKEWEDNAQELSRESEGNAGTLFKVPVAADWLGVYMARNIIDRNAAEADVKAEKTRINEWRSILGLPLQAADLNVDSDVWLPQLPLDQALKAGEQPYLEKYGCKKP